MEIVLLGERFDAREALRLGIVNRVVPAAELEAATAAIVQALVSGPARALAQRKRLVRESIGNTLSSSCGPRPRVSAQCAATADFAEGISAFLGKRRRNSAAIDARKRRAWLTSKARRCSLPAARAASASRSRCARRATAPTSRSRRRPPSRIRSFPARSTRPRDEIDAAPAARRCRSSATSATKRPCRRRSPRP